MDDTAYLSAAELVAAYRDGDLSPVEVTRATLDRIEAAQETLNAFCLIDAASALAAAEDSERRWRRGEPLGPVDGVPTSIKDIVLTKGWPTLRGSKTVKREQPWDEDAPCVARLRAEGAVLVGKTTTPEFAWKAVTDSPLTGITRNPWDTTKTPGGSSGGAGAAIAAGLCHLAIGTDAGGSIRIPSSFSGVFGLKPSFGRVPAYPLTPYATFASIGPMTRTVADAATVLAIISRPDSRDWNALPYDGRDHGDGLGTDLAGVRIAFSADLGYGRVERDVAACVAEAASVFADLGAAVEAADPGFDDPGPLFDALRRGLTAFAFKDLDEDKLASMDPGLAEDIRASRDGGLLPFLDADFCRAQLGQHMKAFHDRYDLLVTPSTAVAAFAVGHNAPPDYPAGAGRMDWTPFTFPFNLTRQPAASVPCGFTAGGLPVGLQIVAGSHRDDLVLRAAHAFETARPWREARPPVDLPPSARAGAA